MTERALIVEHIPSLRRYARALVGARGEADDLVQECLERALSRWHLFSPDRPLRPWLFSIMHNQFISGRRREARRGTGVPLPDDDMRLSVPAAQESRAAMHELADALGELSVEQREVVLLVGLEGLSYADVAEVLDIPLGTVMSRLSRGRERLRALTQDGAGPRLRRVK
ncbi:MAG: RNA polymerase sigma factor [Alphaproteobacteria bacterium]